MSFLFYALAVLFTGLKLGGIIAWSWWLVLLPAYAYFIFGWLCVAAAMFGVWKTLGKWLS